jgi:hypothetical protein
METAASVIAVLQLSEKVIKYIRDVSGATEERKRLREQVRACSNILLMLRDGIEDSDEGKSWAETVELLASSLARLHQALELAATKLQSKDNTKEKLKWPFKEKEVQKLMEAIEGEKTLLSLALQNNSARLLQEVNIRSKEGAAQLIELTSLLRIHATNNEAGTKALTSAVSTIHDAQTIMREDLHTIDEEQKKRELAELRFRILAWLSPIDHASQQHDKISSQQAGTCGWFIESEKYKAWLQATSEQTLFCPGIPGAGKTVLLSVVVADLWQRHSQGGDVATAFFFCDFKRQNEQTVNGILMSLLKQLVESRACLSQSVQDLYTAAQEGRGRPLHAGIVKAIQKEVQYYAKVFILVDALDECDVNAEILSVLFDLQAKCGFKFFATSRHVPEIANRFEGTGVIAVHASRGDVQMYLDAQIRSRPKLAKLDHTLQEEIKSRIVESVEGMQVLAVKLIATYLTYAGSF